MRSFVTAFLMSALSFGTLAHADGPLVSITQNNGYYQIIVSDNSAAAAPAVGRAYGTAVLKTIPDYPKILDTYLTNLLIQLTSQKYFEPMGCDRSFGTLQGINSCVAPKLFARVAQIKPQMDQRFQDQINGIASIVATSTSSQVGTGSLSNDEYWLFNLIGDVLRPTGCSTLAAWGGMTNSGITVVGRNLDWFPGGNTNEQVGSLNAMTKYKGKGVDLYTIGYVGFLGVITGYNSHRVYSAILDGGGNTPYTASGRFSYPFDLRSYLESAPDAKTVALEMTNPKRLYAFSHIVSVVDSSGALAVENNMAVPAGRTIREPSTPLNENTVTVTGLGPVLEDWNFTDNRKNLTTFAAVNTFMTAGNDNPDWDTWFTDTWGGNAGRWATFQNAVQALTYGQTTLQDIEHVMSTHAGQSNYGDGYNDILISSPYGVTEQSIVLDLTHRAGAIWFYPLGSTMAPVPPVVYTNFNMMF